MYLISESLLSAGKCCISLFDQVVQNNEDVVQHGWAVPAQSINLIKLHATFNQVITLIPGSGGGLYDKLVQAGTNLFRQFPYKIQTGIVTCELFPDDQSVAGVTTGVLLDSGGNVQLANPHFLVSNNIKPIKQNIQFAIRTAHGVRNEKHSQYKLRFKQTAGTFWNASVLDAPGELGTDIPCCAGLADIVGQLFGLRPGQRIKYLDYNRGVTNSGDVVQMDVILGVPAASQLLTPVDLKQHKLERVPYCPDLILSQTPLNSKWVLFGQIGLDPLVCDKFGPALQVPAGFVWDDNPVHLSKKIVDALNKQVQAVNGVMSALHLKGYCVADSNLNLAMKDAVTLDNFLKQEAEVRLDGLKCDLHNRLSACPDCEYLNKNISLIELEVFDKMKKSIRLEKIGLTERGNDKFQVFVDFVFDKKILQLSDPKYCNLQEARRNTIILINKLIKRNQLNNVKDIFQEKIDMGVYVELSDKEVANLHEVNHLFTKTNFVENLKETASTKVRITNNTSTLIPGTGSALSTVSHKGPNMTNNLTTAFYRFCLFGFCYHMDVKKAFHKLRCDPFTAMLRCKFWFKNPEKLEKPVVFKVNSPDFGDCSSQLALECVERTRVAPACRSQAARLAVCEHRIVDDILGSCQDRLEWNIIVSDIFEAQQKFNLDLKHVFSRLDQTFCEEPGEPVVTVLGMSWNRLEDSIQPINFLSLHEKSRGRSHGPLLMDEPDLENCKVNKLHLLRTCQQIYDPIGRCTQIVSIASKILVSKSGQYTDSYTAPLQSFSKDFHNECIAHLQELKKFQTILPFPRAIIPINYSLVCFQVAHDGSGSGYSAVVHAVSKKRSNLSSYLPDPPGKQYVSCIALAKSKVSKKTSQANEMSSYLLALLMLLQLVKDSRELQGPGGWPVQVYLPNDSVACSHFFSKKVKIADVFFRNCLYKCLDVIQQIVALAPNLVLKFKFLKSEQLVADLNSKFSKNCIQLTNSAFWREGPAEYCRPETWNENVYLTVTANSYVYVQLSDKLVGIENNPLTRIQSGSELQKQLQKAENLNCAVAESRVSQPSCESLFIFKHLPVENLLTPDCPGESELNISEDLYFNLLSRRNQVIKLLALTVHVLRFFYRLRHKKQPVWGPSEAWRLLLARAQLITQPPKYKYLSVKLKPNGLIMCELRLGSAEANHIFKVSTPFLAINSEKQLNLMLLARCHFDFSSNAINNPVHLPGKSCVAKSRTGTFGLIIPGAIRFMPMIKSQCLKCNLEFKRFFNPKAGDRYSRLPPFKVVRPFSNCSLDPIGPFRVKHKQLNREKFSEKIWIVVFSCLTYGCSDYLLLSGMSATEMKICLQRLELKYGMKITNISADAGSNVTAAIINQALPTAEVRNLEVGNQRGNYCERAIQLWKRLGRQILGITNNIKFPVLFLDFFFLLWDKVRATANAIPYQMVSGDTDNGFLLTPADFMFRSGLSDMQVSVPPDGLVGLSQTYKKFDQLITEEFEVFARSELQRYHSELSNPSNKEHKIQEGSVVQIIDFKKGSPAYFGRVIKLLSDRRAQLKTSKGIKILAVECLLPTAEF